MYKLLLLLTIISPLSIACAVETIELNQTACQFIEPENGKQHYAAKSFEACQTLNDKTSTQRLAMATTLNLKPGEYRFRIYNQDVPYVLGFWLRGQGLSRLTLPSVSGGGIKTGSYKDYLIKLKEGNYLYSCPLNPTPDYKLVVKP